MRLLFLSFETALGSAVHSTPVYAATRAMRPDWEIHVAAAGIPSALLEFNPHIDRLIKTGHPVYAPLRALIDFVKVRANSQYDAILLNTSNSRPRIVRYAMLPRATVRVGFFHPGRWVDVSLTPLAGYSVASNNLETLRPLIPDLAIGKFANQFEIFYPPSIAEAASAFRHGHAATRPLIGLVTQTSGGQPSDWFEERFVHVARGLQREVDALILLLGTSSEQSAVQHLRTAIGGDAISLAGKTDVLELAALCATCDLVVTVDTGTMHVARAVHVPTVVIAPAWQPEHEWLPRGEPHINVIRRSEELCITCSQRSCRTRACMDQITADEVLDAGLQHLKAFPATASDWVRRVQRWVNTMPPRH